jgi:hypothetical protein
MRLRFRQRCHSAFGDEAGSVSSSDSAVSAGSGDSSATGSAAVGVSGAVISRETGLLGAGLAIGLRNSSLESSSSKVRLRSVVARRNSQLARPEDQEGKNQDKNDLGESK